MKTNTLLFILGTRPEAIKLAPVFIAAKADPSLHPVLCLTSQHTSMVKQALKVFNLKADFDLKVMTKNQSLFTLNARLLTRLEQVFAQVKPSLAIVQGDTATTMAGALASYWSKTPVACVEAGLRSYNKYQPFPEEVNRRVVSQCADLHFAPTKQAAAALKSEKLPVPNIKVTGNTVIDALKLTVKAILPKQKRLHSWFKRYTNFNTQTPYVLITGHRRENFGQGLQNLCLAVQSLAKAHPNLNFVYPVHLNPKVQQAVYGQLSGYPNIYLLKPLDYIKFTHLLLNCQLIITDSGGIQEEAPYLNKPVVVTRNVTERPEAVQVNAALLAGTNQQTITKAVNRLITDTLFYKTMASAPCPYGDGKAASRIIKHIKNFLAEH